MKLNQNQRYALWGFLCQKFERFNNMQYLYEFDRFCDGEFSEWRVIDRYGMAGKLWNSGGAIYISGYSAYELDGFEGKRYKKQQEEIDKLNAELAETIGIYDSAFDKVKNLLR